MQRYGAAGGNKLAPRGILPVLLLCRQVRMLLPSLEQAGHSEIRKAYDRTAHSRGVRARRQEAAGGQPALGDRHVNSARPMAALPSDKRCGTCKQSAQWESGNLGDTR